MRSTIGVREIIVRKCFLVSYVSEHRNLSDNKLLLPALIFELEKRKFAHSY